MKRSLIILLTVCAVVAPAWSDARSDAAARVADSATATARSARQQNMPRNVPVRLDLLANGARQVVRGELDAKAYLRFFSQTRKLFWEAGPAAGAAENMRALEQHTVRFASLYGFPLDLPPVGASAAGATPPSGNPASTGAAEVRFTRDGMLGSARQADQLAQGLWSSVRNRPQRTGDARARQDLAGTAEAVHGMRLALDQGTDPGSYYQALLTNRSRLLYSHAQLGGDEALRSGIRQLLDQLDVVVAAYRQLGSGQ